jgi:hypothetical protein
MPVYIGRDRVISAVFGKDGRSIAYCHIENKLIDTNIINTGIEY